MKDEQLARIKERVGKVDQRDHIADWDRRQSIDNPDAIVCPLDKRHGRLQVPANGTALICGAVRPIPCDHVRPISR